ncbi:MAG: STAS domain-containing protein [Clostridia bacterium]|nr:STAS domain-containing protein [Clostridia bacterium]
MERVTSRGQADATLPGCCITQRSHDEIGVALTGDIDHHRAAQLREHLDALICRDRPRCLYVDLSGIEFMDSSGLGLIMGRYTLLGRLGGQLMIEHPSSAAKRMITLAAMERFIKVIY